MHFKKTKLTLPKCPKKKDKIGKLILKLHQNYQIKFN